MIEYDDVSLLHVEAVEMVERVLRLWIGKLTKGYGGRRVDYDARPLRRQRRQMQFPLSSVHFLGGSDECCHTAQTARRGHRQ